MFPAQLHIKTRTADTPRNFTLAVLEYLRTLYKRIRLALLFIFRDLLTSCLALVAPRPGEDLQLSLCSTLTQLLTAARGAVAEEMADPVNEMKLPLSHLVFSEHVEQRGAPQRSPCPCCGGCSASTRGGRARSSPAPASQPPHPAPGAAPSVLTPRNVSSEGEQGVPGYHQLGLYMEDSKKK